MDGTLRSLTLTELQLSDDLLFVMHYFPIKLGGLALCAECAHYLGCRVRRAEQSRVVLIRDEEEDKDRDEV